MSPAIGGLFSIKNLDTMDGIPSICNSPLRRQIVEKIFGKKVLEKGRSGFGEMVSSPKKSLEKRLRKKVEEERRATMDIAKSILRSGHFDPEEFLKKQLKKEEEKRHQAALKEVLKEQEECKEVEEMRKEVAKMRLSHSPSSKSCSPHTHIHSSCSPHTPLSGSPATGSPIASAG